MSDVPQTQVLQGEIIRLRRAVEELSVLNDLAQSIGSVFDPQEIIRIIVDRSARAVAAEQATITLIDEEARVSAGTLVRYAAEGEGSERYHLNQSLLGYMLHHKQPCLCNEPAEDQRLAGVEIPPTLRNLLCVPLLVKSSLIGVLIAFNKRGGQAFDASDQRLLSIIGAQSGQVLETARLLEEEKAAVRLREEVRLAERIQQDLLPRSTPELAGYDIAGFSVPAEVVGGDYYDFIPIDAHRLAFCLGDVSGKGLPASLLMANLQATLRGQALRDGTCRDCLSWCNRLLFRCTATEKFATLFYGVLDARAHLLTYCNAGHERPFHLSAGAEPRRLATGGLVVGLMDNVPYEDDVCHLEVGDLVAVFSDGAPDMENDQIVPFGEARIREILEDLCGQPSRVIVDHVVHAVQAHAGSTPATDDLTILVLQRRE